MMLHSMGVSACVRRAGPSLVGLVVNGSLPHFRTTTYLNSTIKLYTISQRCQQTESQSQSQNQSFSIFSGNFGTRLKKLWKGEKGVEPAHTTAEAKKEEGEEQQTAEEKEAEEKDDKKLMENIEKGKFDFEDYQREIARLVKMAKVKGAYDSVKGTVANVLGKGEAPSQMKELILDFEKQITLLNAMTAEERKNPDAFYDHAFKSKQRIVEKVGQSLFDFNQLLQKYEASRLVYMVLHEVKRRGKDIPTDTNAILPFVHANVNLLSEKDKARMKKHLNKNNKKR